MSKTLQTTNVELVETKNKRGSSNMTVITNDSRAAIIGGKVMVHTDMVHTDTDMCTEY